MIKRFIVSKDETIYEAWPDVALTDSGKLLCVFTECTHHCDRTGVRLVICESADRGRTWSKKRPLTEKGSNERGFNCPRISKLQDGRLVIICDMVYNLFGNQSGEQYLWISADEGQTWSEPTILPFCGIVPDRVLQLSCGRLLIAAHLESKETGKREHYLWYSDDNGSTWSDRVILASDPRYQLCEASILEKPNGTLVAFLRENSFQGYPIMKAISHNRGESWEGVFPTPLYCGHRPVAGFLKDGRVLITYRFIPSDANSMQNTFAALLDPNELEHTEISKQHVRVFPLDYDRNPTPDGGYTGWVQFEGGEIYVVNYIKDNSNKAHIRGYSFYPNDMILCEE